MGIFITKIHIEKVRHLEEVDIILSDTEKKHLVLTGKNGSGKTSLLEAMRDDVLYGQKVVSPDGTLHLPGMADPPSKPKIDITYSQNSKPFLQSIFTFIPADRSTLVLPTAIEAFEIQNKNIVTRNASKDFLKYILNLDYRLYGAKTDNDKELEANIEKWFNSFQSALQDIFGCKSLVLQRDTANLAFRISMPGREPFGLHEMADGYAAFLDIYMELLMRFESEDAVVDFEKSAIVMIDEVETHLHVEMQKRALPFLSKMFPNVQFIVATHSPFVITSLWDAVIYDLEKNERLEDPSFYSYETVVESFLGTSTYSNELVQYFKRYKDLCFKQRTSEENEEFLKAKALLEIKSIPSTELYIAFQNLEKQRKEIKNGSPV